MNIRRKPSRFSDSSSTDSEILKPKADLQKYECSFNIWEKKAKERQELEQKNESPNKVKTEENLSFMTRLIGEL